MLKVECVCLPEFLLKMRKSKLHGLIGSEACRYRIDTYTLHINTLLDKACTISFPASNGSETVPAVNGCSPWSIGGLREVGSDPGEEDDVLPRRSGRGSSGRWRSGNNEGQQGSCRGEGGRRRGRSSCVWPPWSSSASPLQTKLLESTVSCVARLSCAPWASLCHLTLHGLGGGSGTVGERRSMEMEADKITI